MKKIILFLIMFIIFITSRAYAEDASDLIWDYKNDDLLHTYSESKSDEYAENRQLLLDTKIEKNLDVEFKYTNLEDCIYTTLENNYNIKIYAAMKRNQEWMYKNSLTLAAPDFKYSYSLNRYSGEFLVGGILAAEFSEKAYANNFTLTLPVNASVFWGMSYYKRKRNAATSNLEYTKDEAILQTALAYYDLLEKKLELDVLHTNLQDRSGQLKLAQARFRIGIGDKFDILRAEAEEASAQQEYISAYNTIRLYQAKLANLIGVDVIETVYPLEYKITPNKLIREDITIENLYDVALTQRDDIKAKNEEILAQKRYLSVIKSEFLPYVDFTYQKSFVGTSQVGPLENDMLGFVITAPLGKKLGLDTITRLQAERANLDKMNLQLDVLKRNTKETLISSYYTSKNLLEKIEAAKAEIKAADESLRYSIIRFNVGESTFLDVLQAQALKVQARQHIISYLAQYNKAQVKLLFDAGIISPTSVLANYQKVP